jgi:pimeloyl-ACP methyl ester carboxylesterase
MPNVRANNIRIEYDTFGDASVRQLLAILKGGNRKPELSMVRIPNLVIHGSKDPLVLEELGKDTAETVPGAELLVINGMGHDLPRPIWPRIVEAITANEKKVVT